MKKTMTWTAFSTVLLACALLPAPLALAEGTVKAGDVYVTATRVEKELQQVPISVTVMTAEDVRRSGAVQWANCWRTCPACRCRTTVRRA